MKIYEVEKRLRKILDVKGKSNFINQLLDNASEGSLIIIDTKHRKISCLQLDKNNTINKS